LATEIKRLEDKNVIVDDFKLLVIELIGKVDFIKSNLEISKLEINVLNEKNSIQYKTLQKEEKSRKDFEKRIIDLELLVNETKIYKDENENLKIITKIKGF
jgi:hypothetical protein